MMNAQGCRYSPADLNVGHWVEFKIILKLFIYLFIIIIIIFIFFLFLCNSIRFTVNKLCILTNVEGSTLEDTSLKSKQFFMLARVIPRANDLMAKYTIMIMNYSSGNQRAGNV